MEAAFKIELPNYCLSKPLEYNHEQLNINQKSKYGGWNSRERHKEFFDRSGETLGYGSMEDWYNLTIKEISKYGGNGLLYYHYNSSPSAALQTVYPKHNWMLWKFKCVPRGYWESLLKDPKELKSMLDWLGEQMSLQNCTCFFVVLLQLH